MIPRLIKASVPLKIIVIGSLETISRSKSSYFYIFEYVQFFLNQKHENPKSF